MIHIGFDVTLANAFTVACVVVYGAFVLGLYLGRNGK